MRNWLIAQFPESLFLPSNNKEQYYGRVIHGKQIMSNSTVLFCCLARNLGGIAEYTIARIEYLASFFKKYKILIYENDSNDNTRDILLDWKYKNDNVELILENLNKKRHEQDTSLERTTDMAYYRNQYLSKAKRNDFYNMDYTIVFDSDIDGGWSYFGICNSFSYNFDVVCSNSLLYRTRDSITERLFYDTFAYRPLNKESSENHSIYNLLQFKVGQEPFRVNSAFGGMAIYKSSVLHNVEYKSYDCDHPTLHRQLREFGYNIWLNPSQIVLYNKHEYCI